MVQRARKSKRVREPKGGSRSQRQGGKRNQPAKTDDAKRRAAAKGVDSISQSRAAEATAGQELALQGLVPAPPLAAQSAQACWAAAQASGRPSRCRLARAPRLTAGG